MVLTEEQQAQFDAATHCYMCQDPFLETEGKWSKVRDHNHATGDSLKLKTKQVNGLASLLWKKKKHMALISLNKKCEIANTACLWETVTREMLVVV